MTYINAILAAWDAHKLAALRSEHDRIAESIALMSSNCDKITLDIQNGIELQDTHGNILADGEDVYHASLAYARGQEAALGERIKALEASIEFTKRSCDPSIV